MSGKGVERRGPALFSVLRFTSGSGQLLGKGLYLLSGLRLQLQLGVKLLLHRRELCLGLIAVLGCFAQAAVCNEDGVLQVGEGTARLLLLGQLPFQGVQIGGGSQDIAPRTAPQAVWMAGATVWAAEN